MSYNWRSKRQNITPDRAAISQMALSTAFYATQHMAPGLWSLGTTPKHTTHALGSIGTAGVPTYAVPHLEPKTLFYSFCHDLWLLKKIPTTLSSRTTIRFDTENVEGAAGPHGLTIIERARQKK